MRVEELRRDVRACEDSIKELQREVLELRIDKLDHALPCIYRHLCWSALRCTAIGESKDISIYDCMVCKVRKERK